MARARFSDQNSKVLGAVAGHSDPLKGLWLPLSHAFLSFCSAIVTFKSLITVIWSHYITEKMREKGLLAFSLLSPVLVDPGAPDKGMVPPIMAYLS